MMRAILSAVAGYVAMVVIVMAGIAAVWMAFGNQFAFHEDTNVASTGWSILMLVVGVFAALAGGYLAARIAGPQGPLATRVLVGIVLVLGAVTVVMQLTATPPTLPEGKLARDLTFMEAGQYAISPQWYNFAIVVVGMFGVFLGGQYAINKRNSLLAADDDSVDG